MIFILNFHTKTQLQTEETEERKRIVRGKNSGERGKIKKTQEIGQIKPITKFQISLGFLM